MSRKFLITYASGIDGSAVLFKKWQQECIQLFQKTGVFTEIYACDENVLDINFYNAHEKILTQSKGAGYWLWKPYIFKKALEQCDDNSILMYVDSKIFPHASFYDLFDLVNLEPTGILTFGVNECQEDERVVTKRDALILMDADKEEYYPKAQRNAAIILVRKCELALKFVNDWFNYCCDERILTDISSTLAPEHPQFKVHRHDQSVLSVMCKRYTIPAHRDPTQYGNPFTSFYPNDKYSQLFRHMR